MSLANILEQHIEVCIDEMRKKFSKELLKEKRSAEILLKILKEIEKLDELPKKINAFILPPHSSFNSFAEYRIFDDEESEVVEHWREVNHNGEPLRMKQGDIILVKED